jgi:hypothetical protein
VRERERELSQKKKNRPLSIAWLGVQTIKFLSNHINF